MGNNSEIIVFLLLNIYQMQHIYGYILFQTYIEDMVGFNKSKFLFNLLIVDKITTHIFITNKSALQINNDNL